MNNSVITNSGSIISQKFLRANSNEIVGVQNRVSSGLRVNTVTDDASTFAVAAGLRGDIKSYTADRLMPPWPVTGGVPLKNDLSLKPETPPLDQLGLLRQAFYQAELSAPQETAWITWIERWLARARVEGLKPEQRTAKMGLANPHYVLRNYLSQEAIDGAERGDTGKIQTLLEVLRRPYDEQAGYEHLANKRPEWARHKPGCSALSCSS